MSFQWDIRNAVAESKQTVKHLDNAGLLGPSLPGAADPRANSPGPRTQPTSQAQGRRYRS